MRILRRHCLILRYVYYILRLYSLFSHAWNDDVGVRSIRQHPKIKSYTPSHTTIVRGIYPRPTSKHPCGGTETRKRRKEQIENQLIILTCLNISLQWPYIETPESYTHLHRTHTHLRRYKPNNKEKTHARGGHAPCYNSSKCQRTIKS